MRLCLNVPPNIQIVCQIATPPTVASGEKTGLENQHIISIFGLKEGKANALTTNPPKGVSLSS